MVWIGEEHVQALRRGFDPFEPDFRRIIVYQPDDIGSPDDLEAICAEHRPSVVVVDPLADLLRLEDERSYTQVRQAIRRWRPSRLTVPAPPRAEPIGRWADHKDPAEYEGAHLEMIRLDGGNRHYTTHAGPGRPQRTWHGSRMLWPDQWTVVEEDGERWAAELVSHGTEELPAPAMIGVLHSHRDRDLRSGGGDQIGSYLGSVGFGSACDVIVELLQTERGDLLNPRRTLRVCKSRLPDVHGGEQTDLTFERGRYVVAQSEPVVRAQMTRLAAVTDVANRARELVTADPGLSLRRLCERLGVSRGARSAAYRAVRDVWQDRPRVAPPLQPRHPRPVRTRDPE